MHGLVGRGAGGGKGSLAGAIGVQNLGPGVWLWSVIRISLQHFEKLRAQAHSRSVARRKPGLQWEHPGWIRWHGAWCGERVGRRWKLPRALGLGEPVMVGERAGCQAVLWPVSLEVLLQASRLI